MNLAPLSDTTRIVDWDELPPRARGIPAGFDPTAAGVLMKHQVEWTRIRCSLKVAEKGRRTGITFAEALDDTIIAGSRADAGGSDVFYIGDTKEKGLEFIGYCAKFASIIAKAQGQGVSSIEQFLFEDQDETGQTRHINAYRIRFASGFRIVALSSRPANIRGLQGIVVIDEAAFHPDVQAVLDASTALLIWGGEIHVISTHNSMRNAFNQLVLDIQAGRYGDDAQVYRVTFDDAVANGLYERRCWKKGETPTAEGKAKWYRRIRAAYGPRKAAMREELDAIPREGAGKSIPGVWIDRSMREERPVLRLALDDDFARKTPEERRIFAEVWILMHLEPLLAGLNRESRHVAGLDYARHRDFSELAPGEITPQLHRRVPFVIEMHKVPYAQQKQIVWATFRALPGFSGAALDATGSGETLAEETADEFGLDYVHQVKLNPKWYGEYMPKMVKNFEDGFYDLPRDASLQDDLAAVENVDGIPMVPDLRTKDLKDPELLRHGDFAIALVLMEFAALNMASAVDFTSTGRRSGYDVPQRTSRGFGTVGGSLNWRGY